MLGTRGVPARYGGFESAVEEIGWRLADRGHHVVVYCRNPGQTLTSYRGMQLVNLPALRIRQAETLSHSALSAAHAVVRDRPDAAFVFNPANGPYLGVLRRSGIPTALNLDGFEWMRAKWSGAGSRYLAWAERVSVRGADAVIADSMVMRDRVADVYGREASYVAYGAEVHTPGSARLTDAGLQPRGYHLIVARFEPENQVRDLVAGYTASASTLPLVVVGSAPYAARYTQEVQAAAGGDPRVRFLGAVWDAEFLDELYAGTLSYFHGHTVGGTNPSLLRAMACAAPVIAHDNPFNREVAGGTALLVSRAADAGDAAAAVEAAPQDAALRGLAGQRRVAQHYQWEDVVNEYESIAERLAAGRSRGSAT